MVFVGETTYMHSVKVGCQQAPITTVHKRPSRECFCCSTKAATTRRTAQEKTRVDAAR